MLKSIFAVKKNNLDGQPLYNLSAYLHALHTNDAESANKFVISIKIDVLPNFKWYLQKEWFCKVKKRGQRGNYVIVIEKKALHKITLHAYFILRVCLDFKICWPPCLFIPTQLFDRAEQLKKGLVCHRTTLKT